jgi:hypothetical protein
MNAFIEPLSDIGDDTVRILGINDNERPAERQVVVTAGRYPSLAALAHLRQ